jgi:Di-haem oxidoreductase, putative peroxidase
MKPLVTALFISTALFSPTLLYADLVGEGPRLNPDDRITQDQITDGTVNLDDIRKAGLLVFTTPFNKYDGYGDGDHDPAEPDNNSPEKGNRPTLQGNNTFLRVNGLDSQTCLECHTIVSNRTVPATLGIGGGGGVSTSAMFRPDEIDVADADFDGVAQFNGRLINPVFLFGAGGIELVGREMTEELQNLKQLALNNPGTVIHLESKAVDFGTIIADANGTLDTSVVVGVDEDLVVRPFGRKGDMASVRKFDVGALAFHLGMQATEAFGGELADEDNDGVSNEISVGDLSALSIFLTTLERPFEVNPKLHKRGRDLFTESGCADCHRPAMYTYQKKLAYKLTGAPEEPFEDTFYDFDLTRHPTHFKSIYGGGIEVAMFSDLKRHNMGEALAETFQFASEQQNQEFITARLWGVADTGPYMHDGRALTLVEAISLHDNPGSEASTAAQNFNQLSENDKNSILNYLLSLRMPLDAAADLIDH